MSNPFPGLDAKDALVIYLIVHAAVDLLLVLVAGGLWAAAHWAWWT